MNRSFSHCLLQIQIALRFLSTALVPLWVVRGVICISEVIDISVMSNSLQSHGLYSPWNSPGQNTGVGSLSLLQGIFPTQGSKPGLPHYRKILY